MKKLIIILLLASLFILHSCLIHKTGREALNDLKHSQIAAVGNDSLLIIPGNAAEDGDAKAGYRYLLQGDAFSSGIPYRIYKFIRKVKNSKAAALAGYNKYVLNDFVVFKNSVGTLTATPGCLHCHAQQFNDQLIIGLGNSYSNFQVNKMRWLRLMKKSIKFNYGKNSGEWERAERILESGYLLAPKIITQMQGPTAAHRIAEVMASHRDPETLVFRADTSYFSIPPLVIPIDVPALWISKKRKAFTINAMQQGNFLKHMMSPSMLTLKDTSEARLIFNNIKDVWAYLRTLEPPKYPHAIDRESADEGKLVFIKNCSPCHGTYGENEFYPNKLVPPGIIGTDSLMWKYYAKYPEFAGWFNKSWFATTDPPAFIKPQPGYVPPPLDGVWITAPYFHNGSVPTIEGVLNSEKRPRYWKRNFEKTEYDYDRLGWKYTRLSKNAGKKTYDTDIPGYGNYGHYFGDHLTEKERRAVIEYLKTL